MFFQNVDITAYKNTGIFQVTHRGLAKGRSLSYLTPTLYLYFSSIVARPMSTTGPLLHVIVTHSPLVSPSFTWITDSYITCHPVARGLFFALMMEAVNTSEISVNFNVTTGRYISED
jgi:hypothetical protein